MTPRRSWLVVIPAVLSSGLWAVDGNAPGVANFHRVDDHVFRGAQPTDSGWPSLAKLGVKTVIDLREPSEYPLKAEKKAVEGAGMHFVSMPLHGLIAPPDAEIHKILALLQSESSSPVFVHCRRGKDRTGTVIACYRIAHDHWSNQKALAEARSLGMSRVEIAMKRYILNFKAGSEAADLESGARASADR